MINSTIDTLIERSGIHQGDSIWIETKVLDLSDHYILYLGKDEDGNHWMVALFGSGVRVLTVEQMHYLIETTKQFHINKFLGSEEMRAKAVDRMMERLDTPTFVLILRNSEDHKKALAKSSSKFEWGEIALGLSFGAGLLGLGAAAWKLWNDKKGE